jgi:hypothetical protein
VLSGVATGGDLRIAIGAGLLGLGVGAAVSPGLFIAGFSLASAQIQRVFALIELQRGVTAFLFAPVLLYLAGILAPETAAGISDAAWICFGLSVFGVVLALLIFLAGGARLQKPDLERWQEEGEPAWESPELFARVDRARAATASSRPPERTRPGSARPARTR